MRRAFAVVVLVLLPTIAWADPPERLEFTRLIAHLAGYSHPDYLQFIEDAKPEVVQVGWYGAHFYSLALTPQGKGYPANFPVQGLKECGDWFESLNKELHKRNVKVVGHFNVEFLVGDPDGPQGSRGFFRFYRELWDEKLLGPRGCQLVRCDVGGIDREQLARPLAEIPRSVVAACGKQRQHRERAHQNLPLNTSDA